jgi:phosphoserine phosphatase
VAKSSLRLAIFDIDGTLRRVRDPWIHLHHHLGVAEQAKDLPARWQRKEITYEQWAQLDASFWRGSSRETIVTALGTNPFRDGARELIDWFTARAIPCVGISSGLSIFNEITAAELGIKEVISNELQFDGDICKGEISIQVNEENKGEIMDEILERYSVSDKEVAAFGDGTADIPLLRRAGLGIAICPSNDKVRSSAEHVVGDEPIDRAIMLVEKHFGML